jgi:hypothetical protein
MPTIGGLQMIHKLIHPFEYNGKTYTDIHLPDTLKLRYQIASMRIGQLTAEKMVGLKVTTSSLEEAMGDPNVFRMLEAGFESDRLMIEAFCEGLPSDAIGELAMDDVDVIKAHINRLSSRNKDDEDESEKKPILPVPSA